ncbi:PAS domain S-box [Pyrinomonas methylaliphatogenes]|uniref:histidine kinase n=2 Tax=Pyrinomonas methylaliphatogenes TaxID=454194 RepID=A0A0B6WYJ0_9BACT|nr:PAS domain S-box [Pyrinomonas methylaliphatogenes]
MIAIGRSSCDEANAIAFTETGFELTCRSNSHGFMNDQACRATVLIVNDEPETLEVLTVLLQNEGYRTIGAISGEEALQRAREVNPDLVISDVVMPGMDGIELCRRLKEDVHTSSIPVLLASARHSASEAGVKGLEAGADDFLEMPFRLQELLIKTARLVERSRVERHYRDLVEQAADIIFTEDRHGRLTSINRAGTLLFGRSTAELIGTPTERLFGTPQEAPQAEQRERSERGVHRIIDANQSIRYLEVITTPIHDSRGEVIGKRGIARDITERKLLEKHLARQLEREAVIGRITRAVHQSLDPAEVFRAAVMELGQILEADRCVLFIPDEESGIVRAVAEYSVDCVAPPIREYKLEDLEELRRQIKAAGFLASDDAANDPRLSSIYERFLLKSGIRSVLYAAIKVGEDMHGAFAISTVRCVRRWSEMDIALACAVAEQTGLAIRQAQLYQQANAASMREALINRLGQTIRASLDLPEILHTATHELGRALGVSRVHLSLYETNSEKLLHEYTYATDGTSARPESEGHLVESIRRRLKVELQPLIFDELRTDGERDEACQILTECGARAAIFYPLIIQENFRGILSIYQLDRARRWSKDELTLIEAVTAQLSTGIAHAETFGMVAHAKREWEVTFDAMSDGIFIFDAQKRLARVNRAGAALEDSWPHLLIGRRCCDVLRSADQTCLVERTFHEKRRIVQEYILESSVRPLLVIAEPLLDEHGQVNGVICTARDLTELREAQATARQQQALLLSVLQTSREAIYATDAEGRVQWGNRAVFELIGRTGDELIGRHIGDFIHEDDRELVRRCIQKTLDGQSQSYEARYCSADGSVRSALVTCTPLRVDEQITGILCFAHDITEQKQQRERLAQAEKLRALGQLAFGVAHDFNNALAAILGRTQLMRRYIDDPKLLQSLDVIQTAAEDAAAITRRIQTFARQSPLERFERLDVALLVLDAIEITRTQWEDEAHARGVNYDVKMQMPNDLFVAGNASELREVFVNLIINAIHAMPNGGRLAISGERRDNQIVLQFSDEGIGIPADSLERIFEPFYTTKGVHGTGLGLFVSYGIIERHRGLIEVESEVGRGTTFTIKLPATCATAPKRRKRRREMTESLCILVADDDPAVRETLADMLTAMNHRVVEVDGGHAAFAALATQPFDLVFTDLSMPEIDGWQLARTIRRHQPEIGIILVTGYGYDALAQTEERNLVDGVIAKPFNFDELAEIIAQTIERRNAILASFDDRLTGEVETALDHTSN